MNSYNSGRDRGLGSFGWAMVFLVVLVVVVVAVRGLARDPIAAAQAAGIMAGVARSEAELVADAPQMPAIAQAEAGAQIAQINSDSQTRALYDETVRRNMITNQQHAEALQAEKLAFTHNMHQIAVRLAMGGGVALIMLLSLGIGWYLYTEINSRLAVQVAARSAQTATAQLAAARAVAAAQAMAMARPVTTARPVANPATVVTPGPAPTPTRPEPISGRLPGLPTGQPRRERPTPRPPRPQPAPAPVAPIAAPLAATNIPPHRWLETIVYENGASPNGHSPNGNFNSNGNGPNGQGC